MMSEISSSALLTPDHHMYKESSETAITTLINSIKAMPDGRLATESAYGSQFYYTVMQKYDTIVFYRAKSYPAAAAASLYPTDVPTLFYSVTSTQLEPNLLTLITRNTHLVFVDTSYHFGIMKILTTFAASVKYIRKKHGILNISEVTDAPWWVPIHVAMMRNEYDDERVAMYSAYLNEFGPPSIATFRAMSTIAPHAFFELARPRYILLRKLVTDVTASAIASKFLGHNVLIIPDGSWRHHACSLLWPKCDFVMLYATAGPKIIVYMRGRPDILDRKEINLAVIARQLGGQSTRTVPSAGNFLCNSLSELVSIM